MMAGFLDWAGLRWRDRDSFFWRDYFFGGIVECLQIRGGHFRYF